MSCWSRIQNVGLFWRGKRAKGPVRLCAALKWTEKNRSLEVEKGTYTSVHSPIVGDANGYYVFILLRYAKRARSRRRYLVWMRWWRLRHLADRITTDREAAASFQPKLRELGRRRSSKSPIAIKRRVYVTQAAAPLCRCMLSDAEVSTYTVCYRQTLSSRPFGVYACSRTDGGRHDVYKFLGCSSFNNKRIGVLAFWSADSDSLADQRCQRDHTISLIIVYTCCQTDSWHQIGLYARYVQSYTNVVLIVRFRQKRTQIFMRKFKSLSISFNSTIVIDVMITSSTLFSSVFRWLA